MGWRSASFLVWGLLGLSVAVLAALAVARRAGIARRPFAPVRAYLADHPVVRVAVMVGWMWLGWHFFAR